MDLWKQVDTIIDSRAEGSAQITKVKAHVGYGAVAKGDVALVDKLGNDAADGLAVAGSLLHRVSLAELHTQRTKLDKARRMQAMMVEILVDRCCRVSVICRDRAVEHFVEVSEVLMELKVVEL